jgi:flavin reductase (DIM6/NTAB) family NADH-FMN oxidoreductase RutF
MTTKNILLPEGSGDTKFVINDIPMPVAIVTTLSSSGKTDICPVGFWGRVNAYPPLYYVSICQRDFTSAPAVSELKTGLPVLPSIPPPEKKPAERAWRRHTAVDLEEFYCGSYLFPNGYFRTKELVLNIPHVGHREQWIEAASHSRNWEVDIDIFGVSKVRSFYFYFYC